MKTQINRRNTSHYLYRRSGEDRRKIYSLNYFLRGGTERRRGLDRRQVMDRRHHEVIKPLRREPTFD